jgi:hypothetical protein
VLIHHHHGELAHRGVGRFRPRDVSLAHLAEVRNTHHHRNLGIGQVTRLIRSQTGRCKRDENE